MGWIVALFVLLMFSNHGVAEENQSGRPGLKGEASPTKSAKIRLRFLSDGTKLEDLGKVR